MFYLLSIRSYETMLISNIKNQSEEILKKVDQIYEIQKDQVPAKLYNQKVDEIKQKTVVQIKKTKQSFIKKNIKNIFEMILYIVLFFIIGINTFNSSKTNLLKLKYNGPQNM